MKMMLTVIILATSIFAQSNMTLVGGINYSTVESKDIDDVESLMGFRIGVQKNLENSLIGGLTYSQRGFSISSDDSYYDSDFGQVTQKAEVEFTVNYLTTYILKPIPIQAGVDFLIGGELGYFMSAESKYNNSYEDDYDYSSQKETVDIDADDWDDMDGNKLDYGFVLGGRYRIDSTMSIMGTYYFGLPEYSDVNMDAQNRSFQINLTYAGL